MSLKLVTRDFDPFAALPLFGRLRRVNSWVLGLPIGAALIGLVVSASALGGTIGNAKDCQPVQDFERVFDLGHPLPSAPSFPLIRDVTSWYLVLAVIATCIVVHRQWQLMARCLTDLADNGSLRLKTNITLNRRLRFLRVHRYIDPQRPDTALDSFVGKVNELVAQRVAKWAPAIGIIAALLVLSLIVGDKENLFHALIPKGLSAGAQRQWLARSYDSWWAGINHPSGLFGYFLGAFIGAYVIVLQNLIGFAAVYVVMVMPSLVEFDADWLNRDGHYGWKPLARVFRTVYLSLTLHGLAISVLLVVLGLQSFPWIVGLVTIWVVVVPIYIFVPWILFRRLEDNARQRRMKALSMLVDGMAADSGEDLPKLRAVISEIDRVRRAHIRPLRVLVPELATFGIAVILPVILTAAQIWFPISFGGKV